MDNKQLGDEIIKNIGGEKNVNSLVHCATRLRFRLKDDNEANKAALEENPEVLSVVQKGGQYQVVIGNKVGKVYSEIMDNHNIDSGDAKDTPAENEGNGGIGGIINKVFEYVSGTFSPLIPALAGSGMIKAILAILQLFNLINPDGATFAVLNAASSGIFYFLPIFIGITAARQLNVNPFVGGTIAAGLMDPNFTGLLEAGEVSFMNIPLIVTDYSSTVFPMLIAIAIYAPFEKFVKKYTPDTIQLFFVPMIGLLVMVPLTALIFGPFAEYVSAGIGAGINFLIEFSPFLAGIIIAAAWPFLVILGVHWGVTPISIANFSQGGDPIQPITAGAVFAQMGIAFGLFLRTRNNKNLSSLSLSASLSGMFAGVTEPVLYGIVMRYKKSFIPLLISSAIGGVIIALFDVRVFTFSFNSIFTIPNYQPMFGYALGCGVAFAAATLLVYFFGIGEKEDKKVATGGGGEIGVEAEVDNENEETATAVIEKSDNESDGTIESITTPVNGEMIPLEDLDDPVFSSGSMGKGVAVEPTGDGMVRAPFDGKVATLFPTKHAIGLISDDGVEVLIHIGMDTVELEGKHYESFVDTDDEIKQGDKLISFDIAGIKNEGYQVTTPIVITNSDNYMDILPDDFRYVEHGDKVLNII